MQKKCDDMDVQGTDLPRYFCILTLFSCTFLCWIGYFCILTLLSRTFYVGLVSQTRKFRKKICFTIYYSILAQHESVGHSMFTFVMTYYLFDCKDMF